MKPTLEQNKLIYLQIAETIESDILKDILLEEEQVPSTNQFAKMLQINPATAAKGVNVLVDEGILKYQIRSFLQFVSISIYFAPE
ncbi:GntR family transcriptional regulator, partial [Bacillus sp. D-CC]